MYNEIQASSKSSDKENTHKEWRISKTVGKVTKTVEVRQVENGFIVCKSREGYNGKEEWEYIKKEWISTTNPLAEVEGAEQLPSFKSTDLFGGITDNELL